MLLNFIYTLLSIYYGTTKMKIKEYFGHSEKDSKIIQYTDNKLLKIFRRLVFGKVKFICNDCGKETGIKKDLKCMCVRDNKVYCWDCYHKKNNKMEQKKQMVISGTTEEVLKLLAELKKKYSGDMKLSEVMRLEKGE